MCLFPRLIKNRKFTVNKKNGGNVPPVIDPRTKWVPVGCGQCIECKQKKARDWSVRLQEDIRVNKNGHFVTLTFSTESYVELMSEIKELDGYELDNEIAKLGVRRFLERWRKKNSTSIRHWLVTELGHNGTENIHLHGLIWTDKPEEIKERWQYGWVYLGEYVNEKTVNYICKYINKMDFKHKEYNPKILTSKGIGAGYTNRPDSKDNKYNGTKTDDRYYTRQGVKLGLPIYYRNKIYTEEEREKLWIHKLDENKRWICGIEIDISQGDEEYYKVLAEYQKKNKRLGYGSGEINWKRQEYERNRRNMIIEERIQKLKEKNGSDHSSE